MYYMRYLDDISSLITIACYVPELRTIMIEFRPFPIENVLGQLLPPLVHSLWEIDRIHWLEVFKVRRMPPPRPPKRNPSTVLLLELTNYVQLL